MVVYHYQQVTAEDESGIHIWDLRKPKIPIQELPGHAHWYNILTTVAVVIIIE